MHRTILHFLLSAALLAPVRGIGQQATIQDCLGAIPVCQDVYVESASPVGTGSVPNELPNNQTCTAGELNSIWYVFTANQNGFLGFIITPNDLDDDYDWALFDLTNSNCSNLNSSTLVSCNAAGGPGCHGRTGASASGVGDWVPGGCGGTGPINALVPTQAGNTYVLMVSNWSGSPNGYTLDFSESTGIGVFDQTAPDVEAVTRVPRSCGDQLIDITFNENIQCASLNSAAFSLTGPGGPYSVAVSSTSCSSGANQTQSARLTISPPIQSMGEFTLSINPTNPVHLLDLCDNQHVAYTTTFQVDVPIPVEVNIGSDTSLVCAGNELVLDASSAGIAFLWDDGSTQPTRIVTDAGVYEVTVTTACGTDSDDVEVIVQTQPPVVELGPDQLLCPGNPVALNADNGLATYNWQNGSAQPILNVNTTGDYAVTVSNACGTVSDAVNITFVPPLNLNVAAEYVLCLGDTLVVDVERPFASYTWSTGSSAPIQRFTADGSHSLQVTTLCEEYAADFDVVFLVDPVLDFGADTLLCPGDTLVLNPGIPGAAYRWHDGSTAPSWTITSPGTYSVDITTACNVLQDTIVIGYRLPITTDLGRDTFLCLDETYWLDASTAVEATYTWEDNSQEARRQVIGPGDYVVTVTSACEVVVDTVLIDECEICGVYMPNAFSPNLDGVNDWLFPQSHCEILDFEMQVFDRWGNQLFSGTDPDKGWDGKARQGQPAPQGTYIWMLQYTVVENGYPRRVQAGGSVAVIR